MAALTALSCLLTLRLSLCETLMRNGSLVLRRCNNAANQVRNHQKLHAWANLLLRFICMSTAYHISDGDLSHALCNTAGLFICKEKCRVFFFMGNESEMPLPISAARKVSLCVRLAGTDKRRVSEWWRKCRPSLPAPTGLRPEKDVSHPGWPRALATGGIQDGLCVREENTNKGTNLTRLAICEEGRCLSITNKTRHYSVPGPLAYANRRKRGRFQFPRLTTLLWLNQWKCSWQRGELFLTCRANFYYDWWTQWSTEQILISCVHTDMSDVYTHVSRTRI